MAVARGATTAQIALRWILDEFPGSVALFGAKTEKQVLENLDACKFILAEKERDVINHLDIPADII